jgi:hypothetical protein
VKPHARQNATQSPSVFRRSSWIQFRFGLAIAAPNGTRPHPAAAGFDRRRSG